MLAPQRRPACCRPTCAGSTRRRRIPLPQLLKRRCIVATPAAKHDQHVAVSSKRRLQIARAGSAAPGRDASPGRHLGRGHSAQAAWEDSIRGRSPDWTPSRSPTEAEQPEPVGKLLAIRAGPRSRVAGCESRERGRERDGEREARGVGRVGCPSRSPQGVRVRLAGGRSACECGRVARTLTPVAHAGRFPLVATATAITHAGRPAPARSCPTGGCSHSHRP